MPIKKFPNNNNCQYAPNISAEKLNNVVIPLLTIVLFINDKIINSIKKPPLIENTVQSNLSFPFGCTLFLLINLGASVHNFSYTSITDRWMVNDHRAII